MMEHRVRLENHFINRIRPPRDSQQKNLYDAKASRHRYFAKMKAKGRRDVQVAIDVMDIMKTPQQRHFMIRQMPIIKA